MRRTLTPWQRERVVRDFLAERDRRLAAYVPATRFSIGQRVRIVDAPAPLYATITEVVIGTKINRYRLEGRSFLYRDSDIAKAKP